MKSIIVGGGKVGFALATNLCKEGHDVTVVDRSRARLDIMEEHLNINTVTGNAAHSDTLLEAGVREDRIALSNVCTMCNADIFYSYRAHRMENEQAAMIVNRFGVSL